VTIKDKKGQRRVEISEEGVATYHPTGEPATALLSVGEVAVWNDNGKTYYEQSSGNLEVFRGSS
jgi:hypothetical protein